VRTLPVASGDFDNLHGPDVLQPLINLVQNVETQDAIRNTDTARLDALTRRQDIVMAYIDYIQTVATETVDNWLQIAPQFAGVARTGIADAIAYLLVQI
jgi:hypothetical protein